MAVGLEVDANVKLAGGVVQVLDTSGSADDGELQVLLNVCGASAISIGGLDDSDSQLLLQASGTDKVADEGGIEGGDAVSVQHEETRVRVSPVVDQTVCITIERAASGFGGGLEVGRGSLLGLDEVGTALRTLDVSLNLEYGVIPTYVKVEDLGSQHIVVDDLDVETSHILRDDLEKLIQLGTSNAVGAVDNQLALDLSASQRADKGLGELVVVASLADLAVRLGSALGVDTASQVVQLGGGEDLVVGVLDTGGLQSISQGSNQAVARGTGIAAVDDAAGGVKVDLELRSQLLVRLEELLVGGGVDQQRCVGLPVLLEHLAHGIDNLDAVVGSRVVAGGDHNTNCLAVELAASQTSNQTDTERDAGQKVGLHAETGGAILVDVALDDGVFGGCLEKFGVIHSDGEDMCRGGMAVRKAAWVVELRGSKATGEKS